LNSNKTVASRTVALIASTLHRNLVPRASLYGGIFNLYCYCF